VRRLAVVLPGLRDSSKSLQVPFHQFAIFVADPGRTEQLRQTRRQTSVGIIHRVLLRDSFLRGKVLLIFVHGSSLPLAYEEGRCGDNSVTYGL